MGWAKSASTGRRKTPYQAPVPAASALRESPAGIGAGIGGALSVDAVSPSTAVEAPVDSRKRERARRQGQRERARRLRRPLPVYDVATGEDLETPVNLDNTLLQVMFPDLEIILGQVPPLPTRSSPEQVEAHWQAVLEDLSRDLGDQASVSMDIATGARKEGRFMFTDGQVGRQVAETFEKIMAYGGLLASPCLRPPKLVEIVRILVVPEGEM